MEQRHHCVYAAQVENKVPVEYLSCQRFDTAGPEIVGCRATARKHQLHFRLLRFSKILWRRLRWRLHDVVYSSKLSEDWHWKYRREMNDLKRNPLTRGT